MECGYSNHFFCFPPRHFILSIQHIKNNAQHKNLIWKYLIESRISKMFLITHNQQVNPIIEIIL